MAINEVAPDVYRISTYVPEINLQFNQLLVGDVAPPTRNSRKSKSGGSQLRGLTSVVSPVL